MTPTVTILTYCAHPALAYGTMLVFKTLRTGFPTARVEVYDNGSHPEVAEAIKHASAEVGATFHALKPCHYADHLRWLLLEREHDGGPLVLLDPDVALWQDVEGWDFSDALLAGRLMPALGGGARVGQPRLHPSMLWIPDVARLRAEVERHAGGFDLVAQRTVRVGDQVRSYDTLAGLYEAFSAQSAPFDASHLDCFDHLFWGSHLALLDPAMGHAFDAFRDGHRAAATGDLQRLRGIWRQQQAFFEGESPFTDRPGTAAASLQMIQKWQGMNFCGAELLEGYGSLVQAIGRPSAPRRGDTAHDA